MVGSIGWSIVRRPPGLLMGNGGKIVLTEGMRGYVIGE
jgi:hypothetical protein